MFTHQDLDEAVAAGALSPEAADGFRAHLESRAALPAVDEEHFRLLTGFNDIFVSIAAVILLFSVGFIGQSLGLRIEDQGPSPLSGLLVAACAWGLALFFTAKRRMALPSILLLLAFVGGIFEAAGFTGVLLAGEQNLQDNSAGVAVIVAIAGAIAASGAWLHWRRFRVPITVAAGAAAISAMAVSLLASGIDTHSIQGGDILLAFTLLIGVGMFLFAMRWDSSDPTRVTRRSDVAFWLHLLAAPMIVHPIFALMGVTSGTVSVGEGLVVVLLYLALGVTALAIDRRALLVSALAYVLFALSSLFRQFGAVELNIALTALVIGSALLLLSAFWHQARRMIVERLPDTLRRYLPATDRAVSLAPAA
ncbi:MAG: hypothetical protein ABR588_05445 [Sphingomicrobium sp.]|nr:hypothetical protein [Sphingomonadales bacterium]